MSDSLKTTSFGTKASIDKARQRKRKVKHWTLVADGKTFSWSNSQERIQVIRKGMPYESLGLISQKFNLPVIKILKLVGIPQPTYNKKKREHALMDSRISELVLRLSELIDFGYNVFNKEDEKFQRWLRKPNLSLGGTAPMELLDTISGIEEVESCLNRIEYGNFA